MREILRRDLLSVKLVTIRMQRNIRRQGPTMEIRNRRRIKNTLTASVAGMIRVPMRERAKRILKSFLSESFELDTILAKVRKYNECVIWVQRMRKSIQKQNVVWYGEQRARVAKGMQNLLLAIYMHKAIKSKQQIELAE